MNPNPCVAQNRTHRVAFGGKTDIAGQLTPARAARHQHAQNGPAIVKNRPSSIAIQRADRQTRKAFFTAKTAQVFKTTKCHGGRGQDTAEGIAGNGDFRLQARCAVAELCDRGGGQGLCSLQHGNAGLSIGGQNLGIVIVVQRDPATAANGAIGGDHPALTVNKETRRRQLWLTDLKPRNKVNALRLIDDRRGVEHTGNGCKAFLHGCQNATAAVFVARGPD